MTRERLLMTMYHSMLERLGPSHWWPGDSPFEIIVGAILTQNTSWTNVERAIANLKERDALSPHALRSMPEHDLAQCIRPSGYHNIKAKRLHALMHWLRDFCEDDITNLATREPEEARTLLLRVSGIGPETADAIALYAAGLPTFVVDAYTHRLCTRHSLLPEDVRYDELRAFFMDVLPPDAPLYNEYHALIVRVGKEWCHKRAPRCEVCPLSPYLPDHLHGDTA